jgi:hypothetical protein
MRPARNFGGDSRNGEILRSPLPRLPQDDKVDGPTAILSECDDMRVAGNPGVILSERDDMRVAGNPGVILSERSERRISRQPARVTGLRRLHEVPSKGAAKCLQPETCDEAR